MRLQLFSQLEDFLLKSFLLNQLWFQLFLNFLVGLHFRFEFLLLLFDLIFQRWSLLNLQLKFTYTFFVQLLSWLSVLDVLLKDKNFLFGFKQVCLKIFLFTHEFLESAELWVDKLTFFDPDFTRKIALDFRQLVGVHDIIQIVDQFLQMELSRQ